MILYIHPKTNLALKEIIPMSMPALINRITYPVLGLFYDEWTYDNIRDAKIILMDIHWYLSLKSAIHLAEKFKKINPGVIIIAGGLSATIFAKNILDNSGIDYIVFGDGEIPLNMLVEALYENKSIEQIPNILGKKFISKKRYALTPDDCGSSDYRTISFFPTFEKKILTLHNMYKGTMILPIYPYLLLYRGCPTQCDYCYGSIHYQKKLFNRSMVIREPGVIRQDLEEWSRNPQLKYVNLFQDFFAFFKTDYTEEYSKVILSQKYNLDISYQFYHLPEEKNLQLILDSFTGGDLMFSLDRNHNTSKDLPDINLIIDRLLQAKHSKGFHVYLSYIRQFATDPAYKKALRAITKATGVTLYQADIWWDDSPIVPDDQFSMDNKIYSYFLHKSFRYSHLNIAVRLILSLNRYFPRITVKI